MDNVAVSSEEAEQDDPLVLRMQAATSDLVNFFRVDMIDLLLERKLRPNDLGVLFGGAMFVGLESNFLISPHDGMPLSVRDLGDLLGVSYNQVQASIQRLKDKGLVSLVSRGDGLPDSVLLNTAVAFRGSGLADANQAFHSMFTAFEPLSLREQRAGQGESAELVRRLMSRK